MEDTNQNGQDWNRFDFNATVSMQDLLDSYMVPFQVAASRISQSLVNLSLNLS